MNIKKPRVDRVILAQCTSWSTKYQLLLCEHIVSGMFCYDVVAINKVTGEITSRHYTGVETEMYKAEALRIYDEFREKLQKPPESEESNEETKLITLN